MHKTAPLVLQVVNGRFYGGGQQVVLDLLEDLPKSRPLRVELCLLGDNHPKMAARANVAVAFDGRYNRLRSLVATAMRLRWALRHRRPDIIHSHGWDASTISALAIGPSEISQIVHWHTTDEWLTSPRTIHVIRRRMTDKLLGSSRLLAVSDASKRHLANALGWKEERIHVVHNGIDVDQFVPPTTRTQSPTPVIGCAARLAPAKGIEYLIDAVAGMSPQPRILIAGEGSHLDHLQSRARQTGLSTVKFLGRVDDMPAFYKALDVFVLPSLTEGLPLCILEAMATGVPVIATDVGGVAEAVGNTGILIPPRDVLGLRQALQRLLSDAEGRRALGVEARHRATTLFSRTTMAERVYDHYRSVLQ